MEEYKYIDNINFEKEGWGWGTLILSEIRDIIKHCGDAIEIDKQNHGTKQSPQKQTPGCVGT